MNRARRVVLAACLAAVCGAPVAGPVASASASDAGIKRAIKTYAPRITIAEGHLLSALGTYRETGDPAPVQTALTETEHAIESLRAHIIAQRARSPRVRSGKSKLVKGLQAIDSSYKHLGTAVGAQKVDPAAAKRQSEAALAAVHRGRKLIREGLRLLA